MNFDANSQVTPIKGLQIREVTPSDSKLLNAYIKETYETSIHLITKPSEYKVGNWRRKQWIVKKLTSPVEICLVAVSNEQIIGMLDNWTDRRKRVVHSTCFAVSVKNGWRSKGVGSALLNHFIEWVKKHPKLERIELHVHSDNIHAISLYEAYNFQLEGIRRKAVRYEDGRIVDDHIMALWP